VNHHLRGAESDGDEAFVRDLCARLGVDLAVFDGTLDPELVRERGIEAAAREVRYARLREVDARYVATAHQKNDQAETVLMRLLTGSGIAGLRGIHPVRGDGFVRPLLDVTRAEIEEFLRGQGVVARIDRSNEDLRFLRNRVRAFLRDTGGDTGCIDALAHVAEQARAQWPLLERPIDDAEPRTSPCSRTRRASRAGPRMTGSAARCCSGTRRLDPGARDFDASRIASSGGDPADERDEDPRARAHRRRARVAQAAGAHGIVRGGVDGGSSRTSRRSAKRCTSRNCTGNRQRATGNGSSSRMTIRASSSATAAPATASSPSASRNRKAQRLSD
jgi:tRNA(Ile)-lysidine synthetase-like protein